MEAPAFWNWERMKGSLIVNMLCLFPLSAIQQLVYGNGQR